VLAANPHIFNHNLETVRRLTPSVRHRATYDRVLERSEKGESPARRHSIYTKSGMMLGLGETEEELVDGCEDLRAAGCDILTLGQYLQPTLKHLPVVEFVTPEQFAPWQGGGRNGFCARRQRADGAQFLSRGRIYAAAPSALSSAVTTT
jgi:lipoyl synthase